MNFKIVTTFLDKPLKASKIDISKLNDKAKRYWSRVSDENISRGMSLASQANQLLPDNASLRVYYEGDNMPEHWEKVEFFPHPGQKVKAFEKRSNGKMIKKHFKPYDYHHYKNNINFKEGYDYEFDAVRFCHVPFSLIEAHNTIKERYLISIDADVVIREKIPEDFFPSLIRKGCVTHYLSRAPRKHMESGFIIWDTHHPDYQAWWDKYKQLYEDDGVFDIFEGWTDCHAFDYVNEGFPSHKIATRQSHDVWAVSPLQKYLAHNKGSTISP